MKMRPALVASPSRKVSETACLAPLSMLRIRRPSRPWLPVVAPIRPNVCGIVRGWRPRLDAEAATARHRLLMKARYAAPRPRKVEYGLRSMLLMRHDTRKRGRSQIGRAVSGSCCSCAGHRHLALHARRRPVAPELSCRRWKRIGGDHVHWRIRGKLALSRAGSRRSGGGICARFRHRALGSAAQGIHARRCTARTRRAFAERALVPGIIGPRSMVRGVLVDLRFGPGEGVAVWL